MNNETKDIINSFQPTDFTWIKKGSLGIYREGMAKATVEVLAIRVKNDWLELRLKTLEATDLPKEFSAGTRIDEHVNYCWNLQPLPDLN